MKVSWLMAFAGGSQDSLTGYDNLKSIARIHGTDPASIKDAVQDFAELGTFFMSRSRAHSSSMRARLAFALSLTIEFDCYLIDQVLAVDNAVSVNDANMNCLKSVKTEPIYSYRTA